MKSASRVAPSPVVSLNQEVEPLGEAIQRMRRLHDERIIQTYRSPSRQDFNPTEKTQYLNIGYWKEGVKSLDEAAQSMAMLVAATGQFSGDDIILDAGCGYGDAAILWMKRFRPRRIIGIDINSDHAERASHRAAELNMDGRLEFRVASAVEMPFEKASFDKVVSIEASHHFLTREDFFREAFRVLKPGGRLVTTDVLPLPGRNVRLLGKTNAYPAHTYAEKLAGAGFSNVTVTSIRDCVFKPYSNFLLRSLSLSNVAGLFNILVHRFISSKLDYVLVTADKGESRARQD